MADDIAIDIRLQPPSKSTVVKTVEELQRAIADAASRGEKVGNAGQYFLGAAASSGLQATAARMGMGNGAQGLAEAMRQRGMQQLADANKASAIGGGAPGIAEKMKAEALSRWEAERKANSELAIFGKGLSGINKAMTFVGLAGIGAGTAASFLQHQMAMIRDANSFSNPALEQKIRQAERDEKGGIGRQGKEVSEGDLRRARNRADALTDDSSMSSRWTKYWANAANNIKDFWSNTVWSEGRDAERARAKGLSSTGAGGFIDAGKWADSGEAVWQNMASGLLQAPNVAIKDNTEAIKGLIARLEKLDQWVKPGDKNWMTEERNDTIAKLNALGVRR